MVRKKAKKFVGLLADRMKSGGLITKKKKTKKYFKSAIANLPDGELKQLLQNDFDTYFAQLLQRNEKSIEVTSVVELPDAHSPKTKKRSAEDSAVSTKKAKYQDAVTKSVPYAFNLYLHGSKQYGKIDSCAEDWPGASRCLLGESIANIRRKRLAKLLANMNLKSGKNLQWTQEILVLCQALAGNNNPVGLKKVMTHLNSILADQADTFLELNKKGKGEVRDVLQKTLQFFHFKVQGLEMTFGEPKYRDLLAAILSVYFDIVAAVAKSSKPEVAEKTPRHLFTFSVVLLQPELHFLYDVILQQSDVEPEDVYIFMPIWRHALLIPRDVGRMITYTKYMCAYKRVAEFISNQKSEPEEFHKVALSVVAPQSYFNWVSSQGDEIFADTPLTPDTSCSHITRFLVDEATSDLMENLMNLLTSESGAEGEDLQSEVLSQPDVSGSNKNTDNLFFIDTAASSGAEIPNTESGDKEDVEVYDFSEADIEKELAKMDKSDSEKSDSGSSDDSESEDDGKTKDEKNEKGSSESDDGNDGDDRQKMSVSSDDEAKNEEDSDIEEKSKRSPKCKGAAIISDEGSGDDDQQKMSVSSGDEAKNEDDSDIEEKLKRSHKSAGVAIISDDGSDGDDQRNMSASSDDEAKNEDDSDIEEKLKRSTKSKRAEPIISDDGSDEADQSEKSDSSVDEAETEETAGKMNLYVDDEASEGNEEEDDSDDEEEPAGESLIDEDEVVLSGKRQRTVDTFIYDGGEEEVLEEEDDCDDDSFINDSVSEEDESSVESDKNNKSYRKEKTDRIEKARGKSDPKNVSDDKERHNSSLNESKALPGRSSRRSMRKLIESDGSDDEESSIRETRLSMNRKLEEAAPPSERTRSHSLSDSERDRKPTSSHSSSTSPRGKEIQLFPMKNTLLDNKSVSPKKRWLNRSGSMSDASSSPRAVPAQSPSLKEPSPKVSKNIDESEKQSQIEKDPSPKLTRASLRRRESAINGSVSSPTPRVPTPSHKKSEFAKLVPIGSATSESKTPKTSQKAPSSHLADEVPSKIPKLPGKSATEAAIFDFTSDVETPAQLKQGKPQRVLRQKVDISGKALLPDLIAKPVMLTPKKTRAAQIVEEEVPTLRRSRRLSVSSVTSENSDNGAASSLSTVIPNSPKQKDAVDKRRKSMITMPSTSESPSKTGSINRRRSTIPLNIAGKSESSPQKSTPTARRRSMRLT